MNTRQVWIKATAEPPGSEQHVINCTVGGDEYHNEITLAIEPEDVLLDDELKTVLEAGNAMRGWLDEDGIAKAGNAWDAAVKKVEGKL